MPWHFTAPLRHHSAIVDVAIGIRRGHDNIRPRLEVQIGAPVRNRMNWKIGDFMELAFGSGDEEGMLLIVRSETGRYKLRSRGPHTLTASVGTSHVPESVDTSRGRKPIRCAWQEYRSDTIADAIVIELPRVLRKDRPSTHDPETTGKMRGSAEASAPGS